MFNVTKFKLIAVSITLLLLISPRAISIRNHTVDEEREIALGNRILIIYKNSQDFEYFQNKNLVLTGRVSTGKKGYTTPSGTFKINGKNINGYSRKYKSPMPYTMAIYKNIAIHAGPLPKKVAKVSHGCIRVNRLVARKLFIKMSVGDKVVVR